MKCFQIHTLRLVATFGYFSFSIIRYWLLFIFCSYFPNLLAISFGYFGHFPACWLLWLLLILMATFHNIWLISLNRLSPLCVRMITEWVKLIALIWLTIEFVIDKKKWKENRKTTCICIRNTKKNPYGHIDGFFMNCLGRGFSSSSNCCMEETTLRDTNFLTNDENAAADQLGTCKRRSNYSEKLVSHFFSSS